MDIQEEINSRMSGYLSSTKFSEKLQETIEAMVNDAVKSMFSYGELRDAVRKGFAEKIAVDMNQIDFPHINQVITDLVKKKCHAAFHEPLIEKLSKELDSMFKPAPKEITVQEFVDLWKEDLKEECACDSAEDILVEIYRSEYDKDGSGALKIWNGGAKKRKVSYLSSGEERAIDPDLHIYIRSDGKLALIHDIMAKDARNSLATGAYGKEAQIFMMYCAGTVFTDFKDVDTDYLDTSIRNYD